MSNARFPALVAVALLVSGDAWALSMRVACVGDSITYGWQASGPANTYPAVLATLLGPDAAVKSFGLLNATASLSAPLPYATSAEYQDATDWVSADGPPVTVVILLGTNDAADVLVKGLDWNTAGYGAGLTALVDHFGGLATHPRVVIATPVALWYDIVLIPTEERPLIADLAASRGLTWVDLYEPTAARPWLFSMDKVHPNDLGYGWIARLVYDALSTEPPPAPLRRPAPHGEVSDATALR